MRNDMRRDLSLSEAGRTRCDAMLDDLLVSMGRLHRRRRMVRVGAAAALVLACGLAVAALGSHLASVDTDRIAKKQTDSPPPDGTVPLTNVAQPFRVVVVTTDASILDRYRPPAVSSIIRRMTDDELLLTLAQIDRPAGLIRTESGARLTASVADNDLEILRDDSQRDPEVREMYVLAAR